MKKVLSILCIVAAFTTAAISQQKPAKSSKSGAVTAAKAPAAKKDEHCAPKGKDCCKAPSKAAAMAAPKKAEAPAKKSK